MYSVQNKGDAMRRKIAISKIAEDIERSLRKKKIEAIRQGRPSFIVDGIDLFLVMPRVSMSRHDLESAVNLLLREGRIRLKIDCPCSVALTIPSRKLEGILR